MVCWVQPEDLEAQAGSGMPELLRLHHQLAPEQISLTITVSLHTHRSAATSQCRGTVLLYCLVVYLSCTLDQPLCSRSILSLSLHRLARLTSYCHVPTHLRSRLLSLYRATSASRPSLPTCVHQTALPYALIPIHSRLSLYPFDAQIHSRCVSIRILAHPGDGVLDALSNLVMVC